MWPSVPTLKLRDTTVQLYASSSQGDGVCNRTHSIKPMQSDSQLFEAQFEELVSELTERDLTDPALTDALSRLREVCMLTLFFF